jgi:hypothetical protein
MRMTRYAAAREVDAILMFEYGQDIHPTHTVVFGQEYEKDSFHQQLSESCRKPPPPGNPPPPSPIGVGDAPQGPPARPPPKPPDKPRGRVPDSPYMPRVPLIPPYPRNASPPSVAPPDVMGCVESLDRAVTAL